MFEEIEARWSEGAEGYNDIVREQLANKRDVAHWLKELHACLGDKERQKVLDVGCGPGFFSIMLARLGHEVTSIDGAEGMVACARQNFAAEGKKINLYLGDAVTLEREKNCSLDAIVSRDVVWTLYDPEKAFARWHEVLKPGGKVIIFDGNYRRGICSLKLSAWQILSIILVFITEKRVWGKGSRDGDAAMSQLPLPKVERPAKDEELLRKTGYSIIRVAPDVYRNSFRRLEYWKYGYQGKKFVVIAQKPNKC
jgi:SAM-dependent methyltransferase